MDLVTVKNVTGHYRDQFMTLRYSPLVLEHKAGRTVRGNGEESRSDLLQGCDALTINQRLAPSAQPHVEGVHNPSDHIVAFK
jgi:hypothetical protein